MERAGRQLQLITDVMAVTAKHGAQVWLRGGWAMDFFLGRVTRDHQDIDWFAWAADAPVIIAELLEHGYRQLPGPPPGQQADLVKDNEDLGFGWLARGSDGQVVVGGGPWAGAPWPDNMLDWPRGRIGQLQCPVISPMAQIEIKEMMPVWVPGFPRRAKDASDISLLRAALAEQCPPR